MAKPSMVKTHHFNVSYLYKSNIRSQESNQTVIHHFQVEENTQQTRNFKITYTGT